VPRAAKVRKKVARSKVKTDMWHPLGNFERTLAHYPDFVYYPENLILEVALTTVTAAELQKQFGLYREIARKEPVTVTHHGRESLVVLAVEEYNRLKSYDDRQSLHAWELPEDAVKSLEAARPPEFTKQFDHEV
jgi:prevent-host-death family protein